MEEMIHEVLGFFCLLWPFTAIAFVYGVGAWIIRGQFTLFLITTGVCAAVTIIVIVISLYAE